MSKSGRFGRRADVLVRTPEDRRSRDDDRARAGRLVEAVQAAPGDQVDLAYVDRCYTGEKPSSATCAHEIEPDVVKLSDAERSFVLLQMNQVVECSFAWATRFRRLAKDYERNLSTLADLHIVAFV